MSIIYRIMWASLRSIAAVFCLLYLSVRNLVSTMSITDPNGPVVSLTSYGKRVRTVFLTIETIARNTVRPSRVILWIDDPAILNALPQSLTRLMDRGLEICQADNWGPHTKYFPFLLQEEIFDLPFMTIDDDILYPRWMIEKLMKGFDRSGRIVHSHRVLRIGIQEGRIKAYSQWIRCTNMEPDVLNFATGVSGVLYPAAFLKNLKDGGTEFLSCCPKADDVWLHAMALRNGFEVRQVSPKARHFWPIPGTQAGGLYRRNVFENQNDPQIAQTYKHDDLAILVAATKA